MPGLLGPIAKLLDGSTAAARPCLDRPNHPHTRPHQIKHKQPAHAFVPAAHSTAARVRARPTTVAMAAAHTLYDFPVSNNGGRCRVVIYDKGVQDQFE